MFRALPRPLAWLAALSVAGAAGAVVPADATARASARHVAEILAVPAPPGQGLRDERPSLRTILTRLVWAPVVVVSPATAPRPLLAVAAASRPRAGRDARRFRGAADRRALRKATAPPAAKPPASSEASTLAINGAGNGHGIGMSQYGALGFALHGFSDGAILAHYYSGTTIGRVAPGRIVTVLLRASGPAAFSGASSANGKPLDPSTTYTVVVHGTQLQLQAPGVPTSPTTTTPTTPTKTTPVTSTKTTPVTSTKTTPVTSTTIAAPAAMASRPTAAAKKPGPPRPVKAPPNQPLTLTPPVTVSGPGPLQLAGLGAYRGALVFRPTAQGRIETVNQLDLEDYVRGVVADEMPSSWPPAALEAQAIAARTYVLTDTLASPDFDVYDDTRSQMYGGVAAETPSTDAAVAATTGQIVVYDGVPATTYFFASSGGHTEDIQNVWTGVSPEAWLQGVSDPFDDSDGNPYYRWHVHLSLARAAHKLGALVKGSLVGIHVLRRGVSPRVVSAAVVGTQGSTIVTGVQLQKAFGLMSTYLSFTTITAKGTAPSSPSTTQTTTTQTTTTPGSAGAASGSAGVASGTAGTSTSTTPEGSTGGIGISAGNAVRSGALPARVSGSIFPARRGVVVRVSRLGRGRGATVARGRTGAGGTYDLPVPGPGRYRVFIGGTGGPVVDVP